jgi:hypothetical protein
VPGCRGAAADAPQGLTASADAAPDTKAPTAAGPRSYNWITGSCSPAITPNGANDMRTTAADTRSECKAPAALEATPPDMRTATADTRSECKAPAALEATPPDMRTATADSTSSST